MKMYRISRKKYIQDISGAGARLNGGRWNSMGRAALYGSQSISLAKLEVAVHLDLDLIPDDFWLVEIDFSNKWTEVLDKSKLPENWNSIPHAENTQLVGDEFLERNEYLALKVPSAVIPQEYNFIVNPHHSRFKEVQITHTEPFTFDDRLFRLFS